MSPASGACGGSGSNDVGDFECNICFELAQDPIVTLCGHLYCWPCLYEWLHHHSHSQECPVCKALIQEEKLVPLYGRGKTPSDPRSKSIPNDSIPSRPAGQRPETAPPVANPVSHLGVGLMRGFAPVRTARFGNFALSAAFDCGCMLSFTCFLTALSAVIIDNSSLALLELGCLEVLNGRFVF
uniref:E3 ubiquitin-protein ligase RMA n=1 Tax=Vitis vinifera TaxID=29760 RepID=F6GWZ9_VITVI